MKQSWFSLGSVVRFAVWGLSSHVLPAATFDVQMEPGDNYKKAEFRLWIPESVTSEQGTKKIKGIVLLVPGFNGNGLDQVNDGQWQAFAKEFDFALIGCFMQGGGNNGFNYHSAEAGSGEALLEAIEKLAKESKHPELEKAPMLLWGHSAGGQFNYNFTCTFPERVIAWVANKGAYYSAKAKKDARMVPGMIFCGDGDSEKRITNLTDLYEKNRKKGALWSFAMEPGVGHGLGKSKETTLTFFKEVLKLRYDLDDPFGEGFKSLKEIDEDDGWLGNNETGEISRFIHYSGKPKKASWLPSEETAKAWKTAVGK